MRGPINEPPPPFALTEVEKNSQVWFRIAAYLTEQLRIARARNDFAQPEQDTWLLRGDIRRLKSLLALGEDRPNIPTGHYADPP
jgi:hypothetical protein